MTVPRPQHDNHCIMNVDYRPWRIQWIHNGQMAVANKDGQTRVADLSVLNWEKYCADAAAWLKEEAERLEQTRVYQAKQQERELERAYREYREIACQMIAQDRLLASGYGPIDDLEREVVLVDLEDTNTNEILAVDCQTFHLERLTP